MTRDTLFSRDAGFVREWLPGEKRSAALTVADRLGADGVGKVLAMLGLDKENIDD